MSRIMGMAAAVAVMGIGVPAMAQDRYGLCVQAAIEEEIKRRAECGQARREFQRSCLTRVGRTLADSKSKCDRDERARVRILERNASEAKARATRGR